MPVTSVIASRLTAFSENPMMSITQNVGRIDNGIASTEIAVARRSRRKISTTTTARMAPSVNVCMVAL